MVAAGEAARQADRAHRRLGAGTDQAHHVDRRQQRTDQFGHLDLAFGRRAEGQAFQRRLAHRLDDRRVGVAGDGRPPGADVVDVGLAVGIPHARALRPCEEARRAADRAEGTDRRIDAAGNGLLGTLEEGFVTTGHGAIYPGLHSERRHCRAHSPPGPPHGSRTPSLAAASRTGAATAEKASSGRAAPKIRARRTRPGRRRPAPPGRAPRIRRRSPRSGPRRRRPLRRRCPA